MTSKKLVFAVSIKMALSLTTLQALDHTWVGTSSDLNTAFNWSPTGIPGPSDNAIFDSTNGANKAPTSTNTTFSINTMEFPNSADFSFNFNNSLLQFNGPGSITGTSVNPTITSTNSQNSTLPQPNYQILHANSTSNSLSSGVTTVINSGTLFGSELRTGLDISTIPVSQLGSFVYPNGYHPLTIPAGATVNVSNSGTNSMQNILNSGNATGETGDQFKVSYNAFTVGDNVTINISNIGTDDSNTYGNNFIGYVTDQFTITTNTQPVNIGENFTLNISSQGTFSGSTTSSGEYVGYNQGQVYIPGITNLGDNLTLNVSNIGNDSSTGYGYNYVGYASGAMVEMDSAVNFGNNTTLNLYNKGTKSGSGTTNGSYVGYNEAYMLYFDEALTALDNFTANIQNIGIDTSSGGEVNYVAYNDEYTGQFYANNIFQLGNNATINISNSGTSSNPNSYVGYVNGSQLYVDYGFTAGTNLNLTVTNEAINNSGNPDAYVGYVYGCQLYFNGLASFQDGTTIIAQNNGTGYIDGPQIYFADGFDVTGNVTFKAINSPTGYVDSGIQIEAGMGGDVNIVLENSLLYIDIPLPQTQFTIGALNGDVNSTVQSEPQLVIDLDSGVNAVFDGAIQNYSGPSSVLITGTGTQIFNGANTYTGLTTVNGGTLVQNGSLAGGLTVEGSGTLKGIGSISGPVIANAGSVISPGQSIGTLNFLNGFTNNGATYDFEVKGPQSDLINVTGTALINGGEVVVSAIDGMYDVKHRYTILTASTSVVNGYSGVTIDNPLLKPQLSQDLHNIYLTLNSNFVVGARTHNQFVVANQIDSLTNPDPSQQALLNALASLPVGAVGGVLDSLSGYQHTSDLFTTTAINRQFIRRLYDPIRTLVTCPCSSCYDPCAPTPITVWVEGGGVFTHLKRDNNAHGFTTNGYEITGGLQASFLSHLTVGVAGSYEHDDLNYIHGGGKGCNDTYFAGLYGLYRPSRFYGLVDLAYGYSSNSLHRTIDVGALEYKAHSKPNASQFTVYGEFGVDLQLSYLLVQPFVGIEGEVYRRDSVKEDGAGGFGLNVRKRDLSTATTRLGTHLTSCISFVNLSFDVAWNYRINQCKNRIDEQYASFGTPFEIYGIDLQRNSVDYALTASTALNDRWNVYIEGSGESWKQSNIFNVLAGLQFNW